MAFTTCFFTLGTEVPSTSGNTTRFSCNCGKEYASAKGLARHQIDCTLKKFSSPELKQKRRPTPSPLKTPRSSGAKLMKSCIVSPLKSQMFNRSIEPFNEVDNLVEDISVAEVYKQDTRMERIIQSKYFILHTMRLMYFVCRHSFCLCKASNGRKIKTLCQRSNSSFVQSTQRYWF